MIVLKDYINTNSNKLSDVLKSLVQVIDSIKKSTNQEIIIDCLSVDTIHPIFAVALNIAVSSFGKEVKLINKTKGLKELHFFNAADSENISDKDLTSYLHNSSKFNFIPLISFPASAEKAFQKDKVISLIEDFIRKQFHIICKRRNSWR